MSKLKHWLAVYMDRYPSPAARRAIIWCIQLAAFALCGVSAFLIRFELRLSPQEIAQLALAVPIWIVVKALVFQLLGMDRAAWRYVSIPDTVGIAVANLLGSLLSAFFILAAIPAGFPIRNNPGLSLCRTPRSARALRRESSATARRAGMRRSVESAW